MLVFLGCLDLVLVFCGVLVDFGLFMVFCLAFGFLGFVFSFVVVMLRLGCFVLVGFVGCTFGLCICDALFVLLGTCWWR